MSQENLPAFVFYTLFGREGGCSRWLSSAQSLAFLLKVGGPDDTPAGGVGGWPKGVEVLGFRFCEAVAIVCPEITALHTALGLYFLQKNNSQHYSSE